MTTYRMPELLGGGEFEGHHYRSDPDSVGVYVDGEVVWVPLSLLTEVTPPLPEEPPVGAYRIGGVLCMRVSSEPYQCWIYQTADELFDEKTFEDLCSDHGRDIVRLIPTPVVEPVMLPWEGNSIYGSPVEVSVGKEEPICLGVDGVMVSVAPDIADAMAAALTTAAAKARQS